MKLNNHGWGYKDMIIYGCIILLLLLIAAYNINYLYSGINSNDNNSTNNSVQQPVDNEQQPITEPQKVIVDYNYYYGVEEKIKNATLNYLNDYSYDLTEQILKTSVDTLVSFGYMSIIYDQTGNHLCTGYSNAYSDVSTGEYVIKPYVNCNNYITEGY